MRIPISTKWVLPVLVTLVSPSLTMASPYVFVDGTFAPGTWTTDVRPTGSSEGYSVTQQTSGGDPGDYSQITISSPGGWTAIDEMSAFSYAPATLGAIAALSVSYSLQTQPGPDQADYFQIRQNGIYYQLPAGDWQTGYYPTWTNFSFITTASDWSDSSGDGNHPDFSAAGSPIQFGFYAANSYASSTVGVDNFQVSVSSIPEPTSLTLAGVGLVGLGLARRRICRDDR